jgi:hemerythrin-like domain-containing protein
MSQAATNPRHDIYMPIHKALRAYMSETLAAVGRMDCDDEQDVAAALAQLRELLDVCAGHLEHENHFVHSAMERRRPGSALRMAEEHIAHAHVFGDLRAALVLVQLGRGAERRTLAQILYRQLALFIAENFEHMQREESEHNAVLWSAYTDAELETIEAELVASIPPPEMMIIARWLLANNEHGYRVKMLEGVRTNAPREVFEGLLAIARSNLATRDWQKLVGALELPQAA